MLKKRDGVLLPALFASELDYAGIKSQPWPSPIEWASEVLTHTVTSAFSWMQHCLTLDFSRKKFCSEHFQVNLILIDFFYFYFCFYLLKILSLQAITVSLLSGYVPQHLPVSHFLSPRLPQKRKEFFPPYYYGNALVPELESCFKCWANKYFPRDSQESQSTEKSCYSRKVMPATGL